MEEPPAGGTRAGFAPRRERAAVTLAEGVWAWSKASRDTGQSRHTGPTPGGDAFRADGSQRPGIFRDF